MVDEHSFPEGPPSSPSRRRGRSGGSVGVWTWVVAVCAALGIASYFMFVEPPPPRRIVMAGGGREGAYHAFANEYARELSKDGLVVEVRETAGSLENLRLLREEDSGVSVAIVQSGAAGPGTAENLLALGSLFREPLWVFHRADREVANLAGLAGMRIGIGSEGSGTRVVAERLLAANGLINPDGSAGSSSTRAVAQNVADAAESLRRGDLDAAFFVAAFEAEYIRELLNDPRSDSWDLTGGRPIAADSDSSRR